jgi:UDP-hydrolysing UDP-N-acetyl-D-glucosamine 2-epimerase
MRTVGVVTVARSDYGIYRPVLRALADRGLDVALYVGGAHLVERLGATVREVEVDGYPIVERVPFLDENDDSPVGTARALGRGVVGFADAFDRSRPDVLVVLGDRYEMFAAAIAALPLSLPVAHIHGGESTEGIIDEAIRHSMTKLSHLHFASTEEYARRIAQLGEEPWRITISGAPALDEVVRFEPLSDDELERLGVGLDGDTLLVTYHPLTLVGDGTLEELDGILGAVEDSGYSVVFTYPGSDIRYGGVIERIEDFANRYRRATLVPNLGSRAYFTLMSRATAMVGNSSSGIIEAASFGLPVVDVGRRQQGRLRTRNVIHVDGGRSAIRDAIATATSVEFRGNLERLANPYGDGNAGPRIAERLADVELDTQLVIKRFNDVGT